MVAAAMDRHCPDLLAACARTGTNTLTNNLVLNTNFFDNGTAETIVNWP
jgi:hypothetical protein